MSVSWRVTNLCHWNTLRAFFAQQQSVVDTFSKDADFGFLWSNMVEENRIPKGNHQCYPAMIPGIKPSWKHIRSSCCVLNPTVGTIVQPPNQCATEALLCSQIDTWATSWQNQQCGCAPSEDSDQPGHPPSLSQIRVFAVRLKKAWVLSYPLSAQRRLWSDWADAQADLSLRWAHSHVGFVMRRLHKLSLCTTKPTKWPVHPGKTQISLGIRPDWSESSLSAPWVAKDPMVLHTNSEDSDQTRQIPRLIWVFAGCTGHFVGFVVSRLRWWFTFQMKTLNIVPPNKKSHLAISINMYQ